MNRYARDRERMPRGRDVQDLRSPDRRARAHSEVDRRRLLPALQGGGGLHRRHPAAQRDGHPAHGPRDGRLVQDAPTCATAACAGVPRAGSWARTTRASPRRPRWTRSSRARRLPPEIGRESSSTPAGTGRAEYGGDRLPGSAPGCSIDGSDEFDEPGVSRAVLQGLATGTRRPHLPRQLRIVNWCPSCCTAISDDEAEYQDEKGHLWYLRYPLVEPVDGVEYVTVATTRPETMLGDTGVAVSPQDPEKAKLVGAKVMLPIVDREIPIFSDWHVDAGFGTGFVKVTPAHDPNDYAMGQAHDLEQINIFDEHAVVVDGYGEFSGMNRDQCREAVVAWFEEHGLLEKVEELDHSVMHCYRCNTALEPWLSEQWFVAVDKLEERATEVVKTGEVKFHPERWTQTYLTWMDNLRTGASPGSSGGATASRSSTARTAAGRTPSWRTSTSAPSAAVATSARTRTCSTPGSGAAGPSPPGWPDSLEQMEGTTSPPSPRDPRASIIALWVARMIMTRSTLPTRCHHDVYIYATIPRHGRQPHVSSPRAAAWTRWSSWRSTAARTPCATTSSHAHHQQPGRQVRRQHRQEDPQAHRQPAHRAGPRLCDQDLEREPLRPDEPRGLRAGRARGGDARGRLDAQPPGPRRGTCHQAARPTCLGDDHAREIQSFFWGDVCDWYIELCKSRLYLDGACRAPAGQRNLVFV